VSYEAMRWAMAQPVEPALTKFLLVAMADCVNADGAEAVCWPSYAFLARRTGMNTKTVEAGVHRLKETGYIVDTGKRMGDTGKVVVYRLNAPKSGGITPGLQIPDANGTRPQNTPESGCISSTFGAEVIPPNPTANPPKSDGQSPQKVAEMTPKQGVRTSNGTSNGIRKEPGRESAAAPILVDVSADLVSAWVKVRTAKRAGPITEPVVDALTREAAKAGLSVSDAVRYCCEAGWQNFNAGYHAKREGTAVPSPRAAGISKHAGFSGKNYREGISDDGSFN
jgi:hypothetical protein